jgi:hypothetical protein
MKAEKNGNRADIYKREKNNKNERRKEYRKGRN